MPWVLGFLTAALLGLQVLLALVLLAACGMSSQLQKAHEELRADLRAREAALLALRDELVKVVDGVNGLAAVWQAARQAEAMVTHARSSRN